MHAGKNTIAYWAKLYVKKKMTVVNSNPGIIFSNSIFVIIYEWSSVWHYTRLKMNAG